MLSLQEFLISIDVFYEVLILFEKNISILSI